VRLRRTRRILLRGAATVAVAALAACSGHKSSAPPAPKSGSGPERQTRVTTAPEPRPKPVKAPKPKPAKPQPGQKHSNARPRPARPRAVAVPWHGKSMSLVAHARHRRLLVFARPHAKRAILSLPNPDGNGTPRVVLVRRQRTGWVHVYLPMRPNGRTGWVREGAVRVLRDQYHVVVYVRRHRIELWKGKRRVLRAPTVVGASATPTPLGLYYVVELLRPPDPNGSYGPYSFGISAHSNVLKRFAGGDGRVGIHGTNAPRLLGSSVSHGCVRVRNDTIRRLARVLPLGTPVLIRG
jgi:lipoprotein-anchoring transpeptidase ErfK/SrfK